MRGVVLYIADRAYIVLNTECNAILRVGAACKLYCAAYLCLHGILKIRKLPITLP
jgi:uncharacterized membrane protein